MANKRILFFSPHPDDHMSAAGTILKLRQKGYEYYEVLFADGETGGSIGKIEVDQAELREVRSKEFDAAAAILGTKEYFKLHIPNNGIAYSRELFFELIKIVRTVRPDIAILPHPKDYHRDHREVSEIVSDVLLRSDNSFALHLGDKFRVPVCLYYQGSTRLDRLNLFVDTSEQFDTVQQLELVYTSQVTDRMRQLSESLPHLMGYYVRAQYAEAFEIPPYLALIPNQVLADLA
jgi:LmbE family N-acetylglucosaminyl deacetylase